MSVVVAFDDAGPCRKQLTVEVPPPAVEAETQRVVKEFGRRINLPGFRKGRVPAEIVMQRFREDVEREIVDRLVPRYWKQAQAEKSLEPLMAPRIESVDFSDGSKLQFVATVEVRPEIDLVDELDLDLPEVELEPSDSEVDEILERLRRDASPWKGVERPAARGDRASLRLAEVADGEAGEPQEIEIEVGDERVWEELSLAVVGLEAGRQTEFTRRENGQGDEVQERAFQVEVLAVEERDLLPLDDELAGKIGAYDNLEALRADVISRLRTEKETERRRKREEALLDQLRARHPLALPEGVVQQEVEELLHDYARGLAGRGVDLEEAEIDWQGMAGQVRPLAEKRVHARLVLDALAARDEVAVSEEEFEAMLASIARSEKRSTVAVRQALDQSGRLAGLRAEMRRQKTVRQLLGDDESAAAETTAAEPEAAAEADSE